jgi:drug/metabolite transporter (DMT)-like permease
MNRRALITTAPGTNQNAFTAFDWALFVGIGSIWGASFLFMAIGLDAFHPGLVTWLRVGFGAAVLAAIPRARQTRIQPEDKRQVGFLSLIWVAIPLTLFPIAQQWVASSVAGMLNGLVPIFTAIIAAVLLKRLPAGRQIAGLVLGFAGLSAIALASSSSSTSAALGVALIVLATICYGFATNIVAPLQQRYGSLAVIARVQWVGVALTAPYGIYGLLNSTFAWPSLLATAAVGILGTGVGFLMMATLTGRVGPTRSSFITYLIPVVALILGVVFRNEELATLALVGSVLVIVGAFLASRREY